MRRTESRIAKLEKNLGGGSGLHYLQVFGAENETMEQAIERALAERGITIDEVGYVNYWGVDGPHEIDKRNYKKREDLVGWREAQAVWQEIFSNIKPTTGLPSERYKRDQQPELPAPSPRIKDVPVDYDT